MIARMGSLPVHSSSGMLFGGVGDSLLQTAQGVLSLGFVKFSGGSVCIRP